MGKTSCWFTYVRRFFRPDSKPKPKPEDKPKKKLWFLEMFKFKQSPAAIEAPDTTINEATEEQHMRALAVAVATAAAADAAIAAANAAAELVRLTHVPYELERRKQYLAAVKIQSAYRGHLGRKALSALKGIVLLQAMVRGELARKHLIRRLAAMSLLSKPKPHVRKERVLTLLDYLNHGEKRYSLGPEERIKPQEARLKCSSGRGWDLSTVSEEGSESFYQRKQEAVDRRERMKQYSYSHRERRNEQSLQEALVCKENRYSSRFDPCYELKLQEEKERPKPLSHSRTIAVDSMSRLSQLNYKEDLFQETGSPFSLPRRSLSHVKQRSTGDEGSLPNSPVYPAYMAATESAKAKTRSMSTPKQRLRLCDTYSGHGSPYSFRLSAWNSLNGEMTNGNKRNSVSRQMSAS